MKFSFVRGKYNKIVFTVNDEWVTNEDVLEIIKGILQCEIKNKPEYGDGAVWIKAVNMVLAGAEPSLVCKELEGNKKGGRWRVKKI